MAQQTAVEWLIEQLEEQVYRIGHKNNRIDISISFEDFMSINKQAKRMEDEQRLEAWRGGIDSTEAGGKSYDQYYNKTYGNKSDNHTEQHLEMLSYQTEISDEEIEKIAKEFVLYNESKRNWVVEGMKLYREHLK